MKLYRGLSRRRLSAILSVGIAAIAVAQAYRVSRRPRPAPRRLRDEGRRRLAQVLDAIEATPFGRTTRGRVLTAEARRFLDSKRVQFAIELGKVSLFRKELFSRPVIYINCEPMGTAFHLPDRDTLARALYHEALHSVQGTGSFEEECDAFTAAAQAEAALRGTKAPIPTLRDGEPIGTWVRDAYPDRERLPSYQPVGESRAWLQRRMFREDQGEHR